MTQLLQTPDLILTCNRQGAGLFRIVVSSLGILLAGLCTSTVQAASGEWLGTTDATWSGSNWSATPLPGIGDTATFNGAGNGNTTIDLGVGITTGSIVFDTVNAVAYTVGLGGAGVQTLNLTGSNPVILNATVGANQLFNANLRLGTAAAATYQITNSSTTNTLNFAGTIQGGTGGTAGAIVLNVGGAGAVNITNAITAGGASSMALRNVSSGILTLSGAVTSNLADLRATTQGGFIVIDGQTVNVANASQYGNNGSNQTGRFELKSGSVAFNGGVSTGATSSDGSLIKVSGGTFTAAFVSLNGRTWGATTATATTAASTTAGLVFTGGTSTIAGNVTLSATNSNVSGLVSGGTVTVGGELRIADSTNTGRWNVFQVSGGSLAVNDTTNGLVIARGSNTTTNGALYLTGGTTTVEKISFGYNNGVTSTAAGSAGTLTLNGVSAVLYVGSGGIVKPTANTFTDTINLQQGTLGAKADWSSPLNMNFTGAGVTVKAADASDVARNISLSGVLSGANGFTKTGAGTLATLGANTYAGTTTVNNGTLLVNGSHANAGSYNVTATGARLGGSGSITGAGAASITVGAGSFLIAGRTHASGAGADTAAQTLTLTTNTGGITLGGTLQFDLFSSNGDLLDLSTTGGVLDLSNGKVEIAVGQGADTSGWGATFNTWKLIDWANLAATTTNLALASSTISTFQGLGYDLTQEIINDGSAASGFYIHLAPVPEPSRGLLILLGLSGLVMRRNTSRKVEAL